MTTMPQNMPYTPAHGGAHRRVVHIGMSKTGTTAIQSALHANWARLKQMGLLFPERAALFCPASPARRGGDALAPVGAIADTALGVMLDWRDEMTTARRTQDRRQTEGGPL